MKTARHFLPLFMLFAFFLLPAALFPQSNQYLHFDKEDDFVILQDGSQYFSGSNQLSLTGWFYCDALAYGQGYMGFRIGSGTAEFYIIQLNNGVLECRLLTTTGLHEYVTPANTVIPQVWQHIAWIYDGASVSLYVNGTLKGSSAASGIFQGTNVPFAIGKSVLGGFNFVYGGRVDEVSAWNKALTQAEIQDIMANELTGTENGLQLYYKFNQGVPGGNNTAITHLVSETGSGQRDALLMNFALVGETSNFNGTLNPGYQAISFPQIPNHLTTDDPFEITATATSGLEVFFEVLSGPASVDGNMVTLTGQPGAVSIEATQPGNAQYDPATPVINNFMVIDPDTHIPDIDIRHPLSGNVYVPSLAPVLLSAISTIAFPELFSVQQLQFMINGQYIQGAEKQNGHYTAWWTPSSHGNHDVTIISTTNFNTSATQTVSINVIATAQDIQVIAAEDVWLNPGNVTETVDAELPSFTGAFDQITASLFVTCPPGGCGEWDRLASIDAKGHDGQWFEIIRYITPYGVPCSHSIDLTDYMSLLQGKIAFRFNCATLDNGFYYKLVLDYQQGSPQYPYSAVYQIWKESYPFGDYDELQPVENRTFSFPDNATAATLKLVSTGHGWGNNNTGNAAEFYEATHHIWLNGTQAFQQHNWNVCNPNPDGCQPQNGTWFYNRAGWCPGSIAPWFDYNITPYISSQDISLGYVFYEQYVDLCHPNHPDCVSGTTCPDCNDGFNPVLEVACNLIVYSGDPILRTESGKPVYRFIVKPNPGDGRVDISVMGNTISGHATVALYNTTGVLLEQFEWDGQPASLNYSSYPKGLYILVIKSDAHSEVKKLIFR